MFNPTTAVIFDDPLVNAAGLAAQLRLLCPTAFDTELTVIEQVPFAGMVMPVAFIALAVNAVVATHPTLPPTTVDAAAVNINPDGRLSVNAAPVTDVAVGLTIVKVSAVLPPVRIEVAAKVFVKTGASGGAATVKLTLFDVAVDGIAVISSAPVATLLMTVPAGVWAANPAEKTTQARNCNLALKKQAFKAPTMLVFW